MDDFDLIIAFEFYAYDPKATARGRGNMRARKAKATARRVGRTHSKCPACEGEGDTSVLNLCLPCNGTGIAASAGYWDRA